MVPYLLSVTAAATAGGTCDLHLRWNDGAEETVAQGDVLAVYTASAKQRSANPVQPPTSNSQPWCGWFLAYADAYDKANGGPPPGYAAAAPEPDPAPQTSLFPKGGTGVEVVTDPKVLRRRELEAMGPGDYKAAAKAAGVQGFSKLKKAQLIDAVISAEFPEPAPAAEEEEEELTGVELAEEMDETFAPGSNAAEALEESEEPDGQPVEQAPLVERWRAAYRTQTEALDDDALQSAAKAAKVKGRTKLTREQLIAAVVAAGEEAMVASEPYVTTAAPAGDNQPAEPDAVGALLDGNVKAVTERVQASEDRALLNRALDTELSGKERKGVLAALRTRIVELTPLAAPDPEERKRVVREAVERILKGSSGEVAAKVGSVGSVGAVDQGEVQKALDLDVLQAALAAEKQARRVRKGVVHAIEERIAALSPAAAGPAYPTGMTAEKPPVITDSETRPELAGEGLGGAGVEMGGGMGLGGGTELGGGLGDGSGELTGGLLGESSGGIGGAGREDTTGAQVKHRAGAGCKQPDKVDGWEPGRILVVVKPHRGEFKSWGTCEYRVRCDEDGGYTLLKLAGNRDASDPGNLYEGKKWQYVSPMLTDLMGIPRGDDGKPVRHHRMTLRRWFALGRE